MVRRLFSALLAAFLGGACISPSEPGALVPATVDEDPSLPQVEVSVAGETRGLHLQRFGEEELPTLLVMHGSLSDHRSLLFFSELSDRYEVILWDRRGMGLSERITKDEYSWSSVVEEIDRVGEMFSPERPISVIGHSFGAMFAALYMSERPARVSQAMLIEPAGLNGDIMQETFEDLFEMNLFDESLSQMIWQSYALSPSDHERLDYKSVLLLHGDNTPGYFCDPDHPPDFPIWRPGGYIEIIRAQRLRPGGTFSYDFARGLTGWQEKVLLVGSECSVLGADFQRRFHAPLFGNVEVIEVENAGHRVPVESPDELLAIARAYFDGYR